MPISRRETFLTAAAFVGTFAGPGAARTTGRDLMRAMEDTNRQLVHEHIRTTRVTHSGGIEHSFLLEEFRKFANMQGCKLILQNRERFDHPEWVHLPPWQEYMSLFASAAHGPLDLSVQEVAAVIRGDEAVCGRLNLCGAALAAPRWDYRRVWSVQRYAQCLTRTGITAAELFDRCTILEDYAALAAHGRETPGHLLIGLGGSDFRGLRPVKVAGRGFDMRGPEAGYPFTQEVTLSVRHDDWGLKALADLVRIANDLAEAEIRAWDASYAAS